MPTGKSIRIYDLAREVKQDTKRVMKDVRREGADVGVASNSVSHEIAEKVRELPQNQWPRVLLTKKKELPQNTWQRFLQLPAEPKSTKPCFLSQFPRPICIQSVSTS